MESLRYANQNPMHVVALGGTKAMQEFLILHYLATDSAKGWESLLNQYLPRGLWLSAIHRRALLMNMFDKCHIAPSYRRLAHQSWASSMNLLVDLLLGNGKYRYMCLHSRQKLPASIHIRGFSAGSFSGLCCCHLLWREPHLTVSGILGGISLPPLLLTQIPPEHGDKLLLFHYVKDSLCQWNPSNNLLTSLKCRCCVAELRGHYGHSKHNYGHWLELPLPDGEHDLWRLLTANP